MNLGAENLRRLGNVPTELRVDLRLHRFNRLSGRGITLESREPENLACTRIDEPPRNETRHVVDEGDAVTVDVTY
jgi:hypothetical protein